MISFIVPSCHRPEMLRNMLKSLFATTQGYDIEVIAVIDEDIESVAIAELYEVVVDYSKIRRGALNCWNEGLAQSEGEIIVPCGDDQLFYPKWLDYALESHDKQLNGYGVVGMNDLAYNGNTQVATMFLFNRTYCKEVMGGIFAPPAYHYYRVDSEWNEKAKMLGKFYWDERSIVEHIHAAHGKRPVDTTDGFKDEEWMESDRIIFEDRKFRGFPVEWESMI